MLDVDRIRKSVDELPMRERLVVDDVVNP